jgi:hypothetical protein
MYFSVPKRTKLALWFGMDYGTQLMPSVVFLPKNWLHGHVCLQNEFFVVL